MTVLAATHSPARKASKVSPLTAVSGNADTVFAAKRAANTQLARLKENPAVDRTFGRGFVYGLPTQLHGKNKKVDMISRESYQFGWAEGDEDGPV